MLRWRLLGGGGAWTVAAVSSLHLTRGSRPSFTAARIPPAAVEPQRPPARCEPSASAVGYLDGRCGLPRSAQAAAISHHGRCGPALALFAWLISHQPAVLFSHNKPATSN
jgi:hypothetical protein